MAITECQETPTVIYYPPSRDPLSGLFFLSLDTLTFPAYALTVTTHGTYDPSQRLNGQSLHVFPCLPTPKFFDPPFPSVYLCLHPLSYLHSEPVSYPRLGGCYSHFNWMPVARRLLSILNLILVSAFTTSVGFQVHKKCYNTLSICKLELRSNSFFAYINDVVLVSNLKCSRYFTGLHVLYSHVSNLPNELQELR